MRKRNLICVLCVNDFPHAVYKDLNKGEDEKITLQQQYDKEDIFIQGLCIKRYVHTRHVPFYK